MERRKQPPQAGKQPGQPLRHGQEKLQQQKHPRGHRRLPAAPGGADAQPGARRNAGHGFPGGVCRPGGPGAGPHRPAGGRPSALPDDDDGPRRHGHHRAPGSHRSHPEGGRPGPPMLADAETARPRRPWPPRWACRKCRRRSWRPSCGTSCPRPCCPCCTTARAPPRSP